METRGAEKEIVEVECGGSMINYMAAVQLMDDEIREDLHSRLCPCTEQEFLDAYIIEHRRLRGEDFKV